MRTAISRRYLVIAAVALAALAAAFWTWSDAAPERSEAANEQAKTEMHIEIDGTLGAGAVHCDSRTQTTCKLTKGSSFALHVIPSAIPVGGYSIFYTLVEYGSLLYKPSPGKGDEIKFPDGLPDLFARSPGVPSGKEGSIAHVGGTAFFPDPVTGLLPVSFQKT
ncbi:MAG: hypothetical protein IIC89_00755, partial [Chloroflexi bacterium]|nr:hypothetical protein [Chloroflexota bacterium]